MIIVAKKKEKMMTMICMNIVLLKEIGQRKIFNNLKDKNLTNSNNTSIIVLGMNIQKCMLPHINVINTTLPVQSKM